METASRVLLTNDNNFPTSTLKVTLYVGAANVPASPSRVRASSGHQQPTTPMQLIQAAAASTISAIEHA